MFPVAVLFVVHVLVNLVLVLIAVFVVAFDIHCIEFEPRSHILSQQRMSVRVSVVLRRTVCGDID